MHPQLVAGARVGFNDNSATMGSWGEGARSALPMVGDVFEQALSQRWIDPRVEFDIPRPRPSRNMPDQAPPSPRQNAPLNDLLNGWFDRILGQLR
jgi:penicillin-binding protein 1A